MKRLPAPSSFHRVVPGLPRSAAGGRAVPQAQYGMGMPGGGGMPQAPMGQQQKEEGPAQQAPEEAGTPNQLEPLSELDDQRSRRTQIFELNGYLRLRTDYLHGFNLGQGYTGNHWNLVTLDPSTNQLKTTSVAGRPPFPDPLSCPQPNGTELNGSDAGCGDKDFSAANLRFRLEPTLNVTDQVRVMAQFDVLDNTIMGSTSDNLAGLSRPFGNNVGYAPCPSWPAPKTRPRWAATATCPASAPSARGPRSTPSSARCASAACPGTSDAG